MTFRFDTQYLQPQVRAIINKRDENDKKLRENNKTIAKKQCKTIYTVSIFMKLGFDSTSNFNGIQTMQIYEKFCNKSGSTWFSTDSLSAGMSENKRVEFINAIKKDYIVEIYFAIGKNSGGSNDIKYKAEVIDIKTDGDKIISPEKTLTPDEWRDDRNKIWIKIKNLKPIINSTTKDFIVASTGNLLANSIAHSQYHFGYIKRKDNFDILK